MTSEASSSESSSSAPETDGDSSSDSTPTGAIVGAVIGAVAFIILVIVAAVLIFRRRRRQVALRARAASSGHTKATHTPADASPATEKKQAQEVMAASNRKTGRRSLLRPLSMIREQPSPVPPAITASSVPIREKHKSAAVPAAARQSFGPNWPLGSNHNPLGAHPVDAALKKRLSDSRIGAAIQSRGLDNNNGSGSRETQPRVPILQFPPPPPGTRKVPPFPPAKSSRDSGSANSTPTSATTMLKSPRLSFVPVSPIETVAFGGDAGKRVDRLTSGTYEDNPTAAPAVRPGSTVVTEPVSPIESDGGGEVEDDMQRLSYVSVPNAPGERDRQLVSPVSLDEIEGGKEEER